MNPEAGTAYLHVPPTIIVGQGASLELPAQVKRLGASRVLLVTDDFLAGQGIADKYARLLLEVGIEAILYAGVQPDPTDRNVEDGLGLLRESNAEAVVALGGGSPIDAAKAIAVLATNPAPIRNYMGYNRIGRAGLPLVAIPTTAGTGSEATKVAVITDTQRHEKMMILDPYLLPRIALVDYELTLSMPRSLTAHVGVDTLTHGIEAYVSRKAHALTDPIALSCIRLCAKHLTNAWDHPDDHEARAAMSVAACQGGMAFANSSVCLVHGMSRPLGAVFHLPHGLSNAVLLPTVTRYSLVGRLDRYAEIARVMGLAQVNQPDREAGATLVNGLERLNLRLQVPRLRDCIGKEREKEFASALAKMAVDALASGSPQKNPIVPSEGEIVDLYRAAW